MLRLFQTMDKKYSAVIFDMDGTLTDSMWVWNKADEVFCEKHGVTLSEQNKKDIHAATFVNAVKYLIELCHSNLSYEEVVDDMVKTATYEYINNVTLVNGAKEFILFLKSQSIPIYLLTSCTRDMAFAALKARGIYDYFNGFFFVDKPYQVKTKPTVFLETLETIGKTADECVIFEDMPFALKSAKSLGIYSVFVSATAADSAAITNGSKYSDLTITDYYDEALKKLF